MRDDNPLGPGDRLVLEARIEKDGGRVQESIVRAELSEMDVDDLLNMADMYEDMFKTYGQRDPDRGSM